MLTVKTVKTVLLSDCVAHIESAGDPLAMRFEPGWHASPVGILKAAQHATGGWIDQATAANICACSYGRFQIMGDNLFGVLNFQGTLAAYLTSDVLQHNSFNSFISHIGFKDAPFSSFTPAQLTSFARSYNGSVVYATSLKLAYHELTSL